LATLKKISSALRRRNNVARKYSGRKLMPPHPKFLHELHPAAGLSDASVRRVWDAHGLKPHCVDTFKVSTPFMAACVTRPVLWE
jgi:hypothetical protein